MSCIKHIKTWAWIYNISQVLKRDEVEANLTYVDYISIKKKKKEKERNEIAEKEKETMRQKKVKVIKPRSLW